MNGVNGISRYQSNAQRWRRSQFNKRDEKAIRAIEHDEHIPSLAEAHRDSDSLRQFFEGFNQSDESWPEEENHSSVVSHQTETVEMNLNLMDPMMRSEALSASIEKSSQSDAENDQEKKEHLVDLLV